MTDPNSMTGYDAASVDACAKVADAAGTADAAHEARYLAAANSAKRGVSAALQRPARPVRVGKARKDAPCERTKRVQRIERERGL